MKCIFILVLFLPMGSKATGIPVVDTNQLVNEIRDGAYLLDSVNGLVEEIGIAGQEIQYLLLLQRQLDGFATDLRTLQSFNQDTAELGEMRSMRGFILADRIRAFSQYLRKLKRVVATAASLRARPQAMLVTMQLLEQERQRDNDKLEAKLMAANEVEKLNEDRQKIRREIARREQLNYEKGLIFSLSKRKSKYEPLQITAKEQNRKHTELM